jgi:hypothetical protein
MPSCVGLHVKEIVLLDPTFPFGDRIKEILSDISLKPIAPLDNSTELMGINKESEVLMNSTVVVISEDGNSDSKCKEAGLTTKYSLYNESNVMESITFLDLSAGTSVAGEQELIRISNKVMIEYVVVTIIEYVLCAFDEIGGKGQS